MYADDIRRKAYEIMYETDRLTNSSDLTIKQIGWTIADLARDLLRIAEAVGSMEWEQR